MKNDEIVIKISEDISLSDAVCKAMNLNQDNCKAKKLHQSIKPSINQDNIDLKQGESAYIHAEWRNQIGVMLG